MREASHLLSTMTLLLLVGCGDGKQPPSTSAGGAGAGGAAGAPSGGSGGSSGSSGSGGSSGSAGTGAGAGGQPTCSEQQVSCNGACVALGATENGCSVVARLESGMGEIALTPNLVYFTASGIAHGIYRLQRGGEPEPFAPDASAASLTHNATHLFWIEGQSVHAMPMAGGNASVLLTDTVDLVGLAASSDRVFVARQPFGESRQVMSVDLNGENRVENGIAGFTSDPVLVVSDTHVYWSAITGLEPDEIRRSTHAGTEQEVVATAEAIAGLHWAGASIIFEESDGQTSSFGRLVLTPSSGGGALTPIVEQVKLSDNLLRGTSTSLYWKDNDVLKTSSATGQGVATILTTTGRIVAVAADTAGLYVAINAEPLGPSYLVELQR